MARTVYLNGEYLPQEQAHISPFDRGFLFADGVYEVVRYYGGKPLAMAEHLQRLAESMAQVGIVLPGESGGLDHISDRLVDLNDCPDCYVYWQVTRGAAERDHRFPDPPVEPTVFAFAKAMSPLGSFDDARPMTAITHPDTRWKRCGIKSVSLLPNVLARQAAAEAGCDEAILVRSDGCVTEGTARSVLAVCDGEIHTHPADGSILGSITRKIVLQLARDCGQAVVEAPFTVEQMRAADELILVGTTTEVKPLVEVDGQTIGRGERRVTRQLAEAFAEHVRRECLAPG